VTSVGIIVSTYNWPAALDRFLASVAGQTMVPSEVLIADDGSGSDTATTFAWWGAKLSMPLLHCWQEDRGFRLARVRNLALAKATADYLIFVDGDQVLHPAFVLDHHRAAHPRTVVRGSRVFLSSRWTARALATGAVPGWWDRENRRSAAALRFPFLSRLLYNWRPRDTEGYDIGCWRVDAVAVNGFDERFQGWGREDDDFVTRLFHLGLTKRRLRFSGLVYHLDHPAAPRATLAINTALAADTVAARRVRAEKGLDQLSNSNP
jgi:glycosyltransferase involved in cell wall biosynthesis